MKMLNNVENFFKLEFEITSYLFIFVEFRAHARLVPFFYYYSNIILYIDVRREGVYSNTYISMIRTYMYIFCLKANSHLHMIQAIDSVSCSRAALSNLQI